MKKKILIFESDKVEAEEFRRVLKNKNEEYNYSVVSDWLNHENVVGVIEKMVKEEKPDCVVLGNVYGRYIEVTRKIEAIKLDKKTPSIIMYGSYRVVKIAQATERKYKAFKKPNIEGIFETIENEGKKG